MRADKALESAVKIANFLFRKFKTVTTEGEPKVEQKQLGVIVRSLQRRASQPLQMVLQLWFAELLSKKSMYRYELQEEANFGGKPLRGFLAETVLDSMKQEGLVSRNEEGRWSLTDLGRKRHEETL